MGIDRSHYSQALLAKITFAGVHNTSYTQAAQDLKQLAELDISDKQTRRICKRIGAERVQERDAAAAAFQQLPLVERKGVPKGMATPDEVVVAGTDGGRIQILERLANLAVAGATATAPADDPSVVAAAMPPELIPAPDGVPTPPDGVPTSPEPIPAPDGVPTPPEPIPDDTKEPSKHWREDKIGLLMTMRSQVSAHDPCPDIPPSFVNPLWIPQLARELKKRAPPQEEAAQEADDPTTSDEALTANPAAWKPPEVTAKRLVATRRPWAQLAPLVAAAAWAWGFFGATRKAFLGDGAENNWTVWRQHFSSFVPILDFIHALSYVFASALAGRRFKDGWSVYEQWIGWVWAGKVEHVIAALAIRQVELGIPATDEAESSPKSLVAQALSYLQNNKDRMRYAEYRRQGLPITSSYVESAVKQFNQRVKGTEKFWTEEGAEQILQLRADALSDGDVMESFWKRREVAETGQRRYRSAE